MFKVNSQLFTSDNQSKKSIKFNLNRFYFLKQIIFSLSAATSEILFLRGIYPGALLLTVMLLQPAVLLMGLVGVLAAIIFAQVTQLGKLYLDSAPFIFNPLLAGLSVGYLFQLSPAALFLAVIAGIMAFILTWTLSHILRTFFYLPVLSLPFVIVSWIIHLAAYRYAGLKAAIVPAYAYSIGWPLPLEGFLRTLGLIFFLPNVWVGIAVFSLLLVNSRIQLLLAACGYFLGTFIRGVLTGTFIYVYYDPAALNFILVALAIGGFYLLPSPRSYILAAISVGLVALLGEAISVFWAAVVLPVHALPYNIITMLLIYLLGLVGHGLLVRYPQSSPEKTLDQEITTRLRYQGTGRNILLPFIGSWIVWQGVDGQWTHQGLWRYAFDFLIQDEEGCSYSGNGINLGDYYAFNKPILSPVRGWVVRVINHLPDCAIGTVDQVNNWGNCVVIYDDRGFYVEISHFAQNSIVIKQGDRIERGTLIGRCGNSGYSSQPHIHIQAQFTPDLGATTIPFSFVNLRVNGEFYPESSPQVGALIEPVKSDVNVTGLMTFPLHSQYHFIGTYKGKSVTELILTVKMSVDGEFYLDSGKAKLFFWRNDDMFMFHRLEGEDPWLALLWIAIPKLPLVRSIGQMWQDYLPVGIVTKVIQRILYQFVSSFYPYLASAVYVGKWDSHNTISGFVTIPYIKKKKQVSVSFNSEGNLLTVCVEDYVLKFQTV